MQQILGVFGYLEMDAGQGGDFGFGNGANLLI